MKKIYFYGILSLFILSGACKKKVPAAPPLQPASPLNPQLKPQEPLKPVVLVYPAVGKSKTVQLQPGETISLLAQQTYGDRNYTDLILSVNQITNPRKLRAGTEITLPSFQEIFSGVGLWAKLEPELTKFLEARQLYTEEEPTLRKLPLNPTKTKDRSLEMSPLTQQKLKRADGLIQEVIKSIESKKDQFPALPLQTISQLHNLEDALLRLSQGVCNQSCRELDIIHQRMALVVRYLLAWAKAGYK